MSFVRECHFSPTSHGIPYSRVMSFKFNAVSVEFLDVGRNAQEFEGGVKAEFELFPHSDG